MLHRSHLWRIVRCLVAISAVAWVFTLPAGSVASGAGLEQSPFAWSMTASFLSNANPQQAAQVQKQFQTSLLDRTAGLLVSSRLLPATAVAGPSFDLALHGSQGAAQLRDLLHGGSRQILNPIAQPCQLTLTGAVQNAEEWTLRLDANLTTGYSWQVLDSPGWLEIASPGEFENATSNQGAPLRQVFHLKAAQAGSASLTLVYRRPFEPFTPDLKIDISTDSLPAVNDLSDPDPILYLSLPDPVANPPAPLPPAAGAAVLGSSFSWLSQGKTTPIRDQGSCGSCWAFGVVAPLESNILIKDNTSVDLSEQYLISCNTVGVGCLSGWNASANDMHWFTIPPGEDNAGAVLESALPYQGVDGVACSPPHNHPYKITYWSYITYNTISSADIDPIKSALATYGPVMTSVCAGNAFQNYRGGVFSTDETSFCGGRTNHAVDIVGWDDSQGVWIIRNSWTRNWGESGYMRIKYGTSGIGKWTNYIVYPGLSLQAPVLSSPASGSTWSEGATLSLSWQTANSATEYAVHIFGPPGIDQTSPWQSQTSWSTGPLTRGDYSWQVKARNAAGESPWSETWSFSIHSTLAVPALTGPADASQHSTDDSISFNWNPVAGATGYSLDLSGGPSISINSGWIASNSWNPGPLPAGVYTWRVKAHNSLSETSYSSPWSITVYAPPAAPALSLPADGSMHGTNENLVLAWNPSPLATEYLVSLTSTKGNPVTSGWISASTWTAGQLVEDAYTWKVKARTGVIEGGWSQSFTFTTLPPPPAPLLSLPYNGVYIKYPAAVQLQWTPVDQVDGYQVHLWSSSLDYTSAWQANLAFTPPDLAPAIYHWQVRDRQGALHSDWSATATFGMMTAPPAPVMLVPYDAQVILTVQDLPVTWTGSEMATQYSIHIWNGATNITVDNVKGFTWLAGKLGVGVYQVQMKAANPFFESPWSPAVTLVVVDGKQWELPLVVK